MKCMECGSRDVEIQVWVNQKTNEIDYSSWDNTRDTWCNACGEHMGIEDAD